VCRGDWARWDLLVGPAWLDSAAQEWGSVAPDRAVRVVSDRVVSDRVVPEQVEPDRAALEPPIGKWQIRSCWWLELYKWRCVS
jgi:hypothetical protein